MPDLKILIVDDSEAMRRILVNTLDKLGYSNLETAENGQAALERLKTGQFDLIFTDWNMPVMDGLTLVRQIRAMGGFEKVPIIMVTTEAAKDDILEAVKAGVTSYIVKPFTVDVIKDKVQATLEQPRAEPRD